MCYYTQLAKGEISGFGKIKTIPTPPSPAKGYSTPDEIIILSDVRIFTQRCSYGGTTLDGEMLSKFIVEIAKIGQDPHEWGLWWHTHNDFGAGWSSIDNNAISLLTEREGSVLVSTCMNKHYDIVARRDTHERLVGEKVDIRVVPAVDTTIYKACEKDIKKKVTDVIWKESKKESKWRIENEDWWKDYQKNKPRIIIPTDQPLLGYNPTGVKIMTDRQARELGLHYEYETGLFIRISDGKILTEAEIKKSGILELLEERTNDGLHASIGSSRPRENIIDIG
jgi:hypothetical protein